MIRKNDHATPCTEKLDFFDQYTVLDAGSEGPDRDEVFAEVQISVERGANAALDEPFGMIHIDAYMPLSPEMDGD